MTTAAAWPTVEAPPNCGSDDACACDIMAADAGNARREAALTLFSESSAEWEAETWAADDPGGDGSVARAVADHIERNRRTYHPDWHPPLRLPYLRECVAGFQVDPADGLGGIPRQPYQLPASVPLTVRSKPDEPADLDDGDRALPVGREVLGEFQLYPVGDGFDGLIAPLAECVTSLLRGEQHPDDLPAPLASWRRAVRERFTTSDHRVALLQALTPFGVHAAGGSKNIRHRVVVQLKYGLARHAAGKWDTCASCHKAGAVCPAEHAAWNYVVLGFRAFDAKELLQWLREKDRDERVPVSGALIRLPGTEKGRKGAPPPPLGQVLAALDFDSVGPGDDELHLTAIEASAYEKASRGEPLSDTERKARDRAYKVIRRFRLTFVPLDPAAVDANRLRRDGGGKRLTFLDQYKATGDRPPEKVRLVGDRKRRRPYPVTLGNLERSDGLGEGIRSPDGAPRPGGEATERQDKASRRAKASAVEDTSTDQAAASQPEATAAYLAGKGCREGTAPTGRYRYAACPGHAGSVWDAAYSLADGAFKCFTTGCVVGAACHAASTDGQAAFISLRELVAIVDGPVAAASYDDVGGRRPPAPGPPDAPADLLPGQRTIGH